MLQQFGIELVFFALIIFLLISGANFFKSDILNPNYLFANGQTFLTDLFHSVVNSQIYELYKIALYFLAIFFLTIIFYCIVRLLEIRKKEHDHHHHEIHEYAKRQKEKENKTKSGEGVSINPRWNETVAYVLSDSPSDWKLAIMEADSMLDTLLTDLGFKGASLGDKLKMANQETFRGLSSAWEVHNIRNKIAHEGMDFQLSHHEAKRVIALYEQIFRNYGFI